MPNHEQLTGIPDEVREMQQRAFGDMFKNIPAQNRYFTPPTDEKQAAIDRMKARDDAMYAELYRLADEADALRGGEGATHE